MKWEEQWNRQDELIKVATPLKIVGGGNNLYGLGSTAKEVTYPDARGYAAAKKAKPRTSDTDQKIK